MNFVRRFVFVSVAGACDAYGAFAHAQTTPVAPLEDGGAPKPHTGFQFALRTGAMGPFGQASGAPGDSMGNTFSWEVPLLIDGGWKPSPNVFVGGYVGLGFGGPAGQSAQACADNNLTCVTASFRLGLEAQYQFRPDATLNPWIGYGIGLESTGFAGSSGGTTYSVAAAGVEFGHFMAGLDVRLSRTVGIGPFVDYSVGQYSTLSEKENGVTTSGTLANQALHEWLLIGARVVLFP